MARLFLLIATLVAGAIGAAPIPFTPVARRLPAASYSFGRCHGAHPCAAAIIPGDSFAEDVVVSGTLNFLNIYNLLITGRILLSWFPQAQGVAALRPVFQLTDPYLNTFRRLGLVIGGIDLSVLPAFLVLSVATNAVGALGCELPKDMRRSALETQRWMKDVRSKARAKMQLREAGN